MRRHISRIMHRKTKLAVALATALLILPSCAPSGMTRVSQTDISSAYSRSDLSIAAARGAVPVILSGRIPAADALAAERALLAALPRYYTADLTWRVGAAGETGTRLVFAFGPDPIYPPDRLCALSAGFSVTPPSANTPIQAAAAYCRGASALSSTVGDVIDPEGVSGEKAAALVASMTNALLPQRNPMDDHDFRRPLFLRTGN